MIAASILLKATVVIVVALAGTRLARRSRAAVRHALLAAGFAVLLVLPLASLVTPIVRVPVPAAVEDAISPLDVAPGLDTALVASPVPETTVAPAAPSNSWPSTSSLLLAIWAVGTLVFLLPVIAGLWQLRSLRRSALPWRDGRATVDALAAVVDIRRPIDVLLHESLAGPMTCGSLRPAIVLPIDAREWTAEDLQRAIVHEMEHIRRGDWISHCLSRIVASCYWFHPIVWVAWRQLALEAERACDDAVILSTSLPSTSLPSTSLPSTSLRAGGSAESDRSTAYADQLVLMAERLSATSSQPQLAMASRRDLSTRVCAVLDAQQRRGRAGARYVATVIAVTAVIAMGMSSIRIVSASDLSGGAGAGHIRPAQAKPKYDAATIKPCDVEEVPTGARGAAGGTNATFSPGRFYVPCVTTEQLIYLAYASYGAPLDEHLANDDAGTASNATKIRGGPAWVHSLKDKYQIEASAVGATERTVLMGSMLQSLLEDRFHLKIHRDTEEVPLLSLAVAKGGFKLKPMKEGDCDPDADPGPPQGGAKPKCGNLMMLGGNGKTVWTFNGFHLDSLASQLSRAIGIHVVDKTGISDTFMFRFEFEREQDGTTSDASVSGALQDQLGLKLDKAKGPRGFIVIDSIERPTPDLSAEASATPDLSAEASAKADGAIVHVAIPSRAAGPRPQRQ